MKLSVPYSLYINEEITYNKIEAKLGITSVKNDVLSSHKQFFPKQMQSDRLKSFREIYYLNSDQLN
jgi:hypothetical protein